MDITRFPSDIWGVIFSQLDVKSMLSLALTCRRFREIFMTLPGTTLFGDRWKFCHRYKSEIPYYDSNHNLKRKEMHGRLTYSEATQPEICQWFSSTQGPARLRYAMAVTGGYVSKQFSMESSVVDYHIVVPGVSQRFRSPTESRRHHVFRLNFEDKKTLYTQYHRNGRVMIKATYYYYLITSCEMFNDRGKQVFSMYLNMDDRTFHFKQGKDEWTDGYSYYQAKTSYMIRHHFPSYVPQVIRLDDYHLLHHKLSPYETNLAIQTSAIRAIYMTPADLV